MKRKTVDFDNAVDGKQLKKIKKLTFQLDEDNNDDVELEASNINSRDSRLKKVSVSDNESNNSDNDNDLSDDNDDTETINDEDAAALKQFLAPSFAKDVIEGMNEAKEEVYENLGVDQFQDFDWDKEDGLKEELKKMSEILKHYKKGRIFPKFVKVLPQVVNGEYILEHLNFPEWSKTAVQYMSELYKAKGGEKIEIYFKNFLLPYVRENIAKNRRLDNVLYKTLQDSLFRRKEFMTGLLLPWCHDNLTSIEAEIIGNVLKNSTVKVDVAGPVMTILMRNLPYSKEILIILRALLEKQYNLPYQTIEVFVDYFHQSVTGDFSKHYQEAGRMPLLWFQTLNLFVSLCHPNLSEVGTSKLLQVCKVHVHDKITDATRAYLRMSPHGNKMDH